MAGEQQEGTAAVDAETGDVRAVGWQWRVTRAFFITVAALAGMLLAAAFLLDTPLGRRLVAEQIQALEFENGMRIGIGRIEGSLYGAVVIHDLSLKDPKGEFLFSPRVDLDWRPLALIDNHLDIRSAVAERMMLHRLPQFRETPPSGKPLLPDYDIDVGKLEVGRFVIEAPVTGERRLAKLVGRAHIKGGRAQLHFTGETVAVEGGAAGDRIAIDLDAVPNENRLVLDAGIDAPSGGVLAAMTGLAAPLALNVRGSGTWREWNGVLAADSGKSEMARLRLAARDGSFSLKGPARLAPVARGSLAKLLGPVTRFDLKASLKDGTVGLGGGLSSEAFSLAASGAIDFSGNRFEQLHLDMDLLDPSALDKTLRGNGLRARLAFDGDLAAPRVNYSLDATRIAFGAVGLEQFSASGTARIEAGRTDIPVTATAGRLTGFDGVAGGTLARVRIDGDAMIKGGRLLADNIRIRSDRIDATAVMLADLDTGRFSGSLSGQVDGYRLESVAILKLDAKADLEAGGAAGFGLNGRLRARSTELLSEGAKQVLGGNFAASGDIRYRESTLSLANLRLEAPDLSVAGGHGTYFADGRIALKADATSGRYGRIAVRLAGTLGAPDARITAERPGLGVGLADLEARITGVRDGFRFAVTGDTDYGPLTADVGLQTGEPLQLQINRADLSGVRFSGSLRRSPEGPFTGTLRADGNGLGGIVTLGAEGQFQEASFKLRSTGTVFKGRAGLVIGSAIVDGRAVFYERPHVAVDAQLADTRFGQFDINAARIRIDYRDGRGQAKALVEGGGDLPFRLGANARLEPDIWQVALSGKLRGIPISTTSPARIRPGNGDYELLPASIKFGRGDIQLSGSYGEAVKLQALLDGVDLALVNAFVPGLGIGGKASGRFDFAHGEAETFPRARASMKLDGFTRTTALAVSQPVDVSLAGNLDNDGGELRAVMRARGGIIGRMQLSLHPSAAQSGSWQERLRGAPLGGGIRYNGPADTLLSLAGQPDQRLTGPIAVAADFSCRLADPCLSGIVRGSGLAYENRTFGTRLAGLDIQGRFEGDQLRIEKLTAAAGEGTVSASGQIGLSSSRGFPLDVALSLDRAQLARSDAVTTRATGELRLTKTAGETALLSGKLQLPETRYRIVREGAAQVPQLAGVRFLPPKGRKRITGNELPEAVASLFDGIRLDIDVVAPARLYVSGMGLESEWSARFKLLGTPAQPRLDGAFALQRGTLGFAGRSFKLTKGTIRFEGGSDIDPELDLTATENIEELAVSIDIGGRASDPRITFSSVPSLPQDEIFSRILFGRSIANLSALQAVQLAASLNSLRGSGKGLDPLGKLRSVAGIDRLRIVAADETTGQGTAIAAGQYLTDNIYVELITDARGFTATQLEISLTRWLSVLSQAGGSGGNNINLRIKKDY